MTDEIGEIEEVETLSIFEEMAAPFPAMSIRWRIGRTTKDKTKVLPFAYVNSRDVQHRLDEVAGPENWQCKYPFLGCCELSVRVNGEWITKSNIADETHIEPKKGQASDAFKRAASMFGIARYLYEVPHWWFPYDDSGNLSDEIIGQLTQRFHEWQFKFKSKRERDKYITEIHRCWATEDTFGMKELVGELDNEQQLDIWREFSPTVRRGIKELIQQEDAA